MLTIPGPGWVVDRDVVGPGASRFVLGPWGPGTIIDRVVFVFSSDLAGAVDFGAGLSRVSEATDAALAGSQSIIKSDGGTTGAVKLATVTFAANEAVEVTLPVGFIVKDGAMYVTGVAAMSGTGSHFTVVAVHTLCILGEVGGRIVQLPPPGSG